MGAVGPHGPDQFIGCLGREDLFDLNREGISPDVVFRPQVFEQRQYRKDVGYQRDVFQADLFLGQKGSGQCGEHGVFGTAYTDFSGEFLVWIPEDPDLLHLVFILDERWRKYNVLAGSGS